VIATHKCRSATPAETDDRPALHRQSELIGARLQRGPTCRLRLGLKMTYTQRAAGLDGGCAIAPWRAGQRIGISRNRRRLSGHV
jgi:hypothetical protein